MISFYPGPSRLYPSVGKHMQEAVKEGVLSINHRSKEFIVISSRTIKLLKKKLNMPESYTVFFTSSATESWEIIAQSLIKENSIHFHNGAFGEKWFEYTKKIVPKARAVEFDINQILSTDNLSLNSDTELICFVQNETSNATQIPSSIVSELRKKFPSQLIAIDATSSMGGVNLNFEDGDIWLASVQKCFGLPAGLGLLICSPKAINRAKELNENTHYNSLLFLDEKMKLWQTSYTPNVLLIYLLGKVLAEVPVISKVHKQVLARAKEWYLFFEDFKTVKLLVSNPEIRSHTVIAVKGEESQIQKLKDKAKKEGLLLGNGYGKWSKDSFRIANFPALSDKEIRQLKNFLRKNIK